MASRTRAPDIRIKRVYDAPARSDGKRVLVDRMWPRGIRKADAALDEWLRDVASSTGLRQWFAHDPERWPEFRKRYRAELRTHKAALAALQKQATQRRVTLLYGARDRQFNQAVVLAEMLAGE